MDLTVVLLCIAAIGVILFTALGCLSAPVDLAPIVQALVGIQAQVGAGNQAATAGGNVVQGDSVTSWLYAIGSVAERLLTIVVSAYGGSKWYMHLDRPRRLKRDDRRSGKDRRTRFNPVMPDKRVRDRRTKKN